MNAARHGISNDAVLKQFANFKERFSRPFWNMTEHEASITAAYTVFRMCGKNHEEAWQRANEDAPTS